MTQKPGDAPPGVWQSVRVRSVGRMQSRGRARDDRIRWARLAVHAIHRMHRAGVLDRRGAAADEARIRVHLIRAFGAESDGSLRDVGALLDLVLGAVAMSREQVAEAAVGWQESDRRHMLELRRIKNLLLPLRDLDLESHLGTAGDPAGPQIDAWLELIPRLP